MRTTDLPAPEWKLLGQLKIAFSTDAEGIVGAWLRNTLVPLDLPAEFQRRFINSVDATIAQPTPPNGAMLEADPVHLLIFITTIHASKRSTWGFFHLEKMDSAANECDPRNHSIEFYLYVESR
jgi:hypothetical protein